MTINIGDVSVSVPVAIDKWAHESDDNMSEFNGMINSMMYAVNKAMKERYTAGPYQKVYEKQLKELIDTGLTKEEANSCIEKLVDLSLKDIDEKVSKMSDTDAFLNLLSLLK